MVLPTEPKNKKNTIEETIPGLSFTLEKDKKKNETLSNDQVPQQEQDVKEKEHEKEPIEKGKSKVSQAVENSEPSNIRTTEPVEEGLRHRRSHPSEQNTQSQSPSVSSVSSQSLIKLPDASYVGLRVSIDDKGSKIASM